jgi:hypothetical protein
MFTIYVFDSGVLKVRRSSARTSGGLASRRFARRYQEATEAAEDKVHSSAIRSNIALRFNVFREVRAANSLLGRLQSCNFWNPFRVHAACKYLARRC